MTLVIDASVIVKWLINDAAREPDTAEAAQLIEDVATCKLPILQPVHWLIEVAAVLARLNPRTSLFDLELLAAMEFPVSDEPAILQRAMQISIDTGEHLFDTAYRAVALETPAGLCVTADDR